MTLIQSSALRGIAVAFAALLIAAPAANAVSLSVEGGTASVLPTSFSLADDPAYAGLSGGVGDVGDSITTFVADEIAGAGLKVNSAARVRFTYLGVEAGGFNEVTFAGGSVFDTASSVVGDVTGFFDVMAGFLDFSVLNSFRRLSASITNAVGGDAGLKLGFSEVFNGGSSILVFFDGANPDVDYDDIGFRIDVTAIPLPPAALMMMSALIGVALLGRRRT